MKIGYYLKLIPKSGNKSRKMGNRFIFYKKFRNDGVDILLHMFYNILIKISSQEMRVLITTTTKIINIEKECEYYVNAYVME